MPTQACNESLHSEPDDSAEDECTGLVASVDGIDPAGSDVELGPRETTRANLTGGNERTTRAVANVCATTGNGNGGAEAALDLLNPARRG